MNEWGVVSVLVVLVTLIAGIVTPILKLNTSIVKLTVITASLVETFKEFKESNKEGHEKIWCHEKEQDATLNAHEVRITTLEKMEE